VNAAIKKMRALFKPKRPEMPAQCASCPFLEGNTEQFKAICDRIAASSGEGPVSLRQVAGARRRIRFEVLRNGDFYCHSSVYNADLSMRPTDEWLQCPGATRVFRGE
jgi:hypothetical protein